MSHRLSPSSRRVLRVVAAAAALSVGVAGPAGARASFAHGCPDNMVTEKGTCARLVPADALTEYQKKQAAQKARQRADAYQQVTTGQRTRGFLFPDSYTLPEVARMRIFSEGEGNGKKTYTCGPSATRNLVAAMYKRKYGKYKDFGEATFARWEGTTKAGTSRHNIARALNTHFKSFGHWNDFRPLDADLYLVAVMASTSRTKRAVIANVNTRPLKYFHGHQLAHFNLVYGYGRDKVGRFLKIAEEWDPAYTYGRLPSSYVKNPYGLHIEPLRTAFVAINDSPIHGIVA